MVNDDISPPNEINTSDIANFIFNSQDDDFLEYTLPGHTRRGAILYIKPRKDLNADQLVEFYESRIFVYNIKMEELHECINAIKKHIALIESGRPKSDGSPSERANYVFCLKYSTLSSHNEDDVIFMRDEINPPDNRSGGCIWYNSKCEYQLKKIRCIEISSNYKLYLLGGLILIPCILLSLNGIPNSFF